MAYTGQYIPELLPMVIMAEARNGSIFDTLIRSCRKTSLSRVFHWISRSSKLSLVLLKVNLSLPHGARAWLQICLASTSHRTWSPELSFQFNYLEFTVNVSIRVRILIAFITYLLVDIHQKKKIAPIASKLQRTKAASKLPTLHFLFR
jgi:hypothetical protein